MSQISPIMVEEQHIYCKVLLSFSAIQYNFTTICRNDPIFKPLPFQSKLNNIGQVQISDIIGPFQKINLKQWYKNSYLYRFYVSKVLRDQTALGGDLSVRKSILPNSPFQLSYDLLKNVPNQLYYSLARRSEERRARE